MKFRSAYSQSVHFPSPTGSRFRKTYIRKGESLIENGVEDIYDSVQKASEGRLLPDLIRRVANGDISAIPDPVDSFVDITNAPKDMLEAHQMLTDARDKYNSLPSDLRSKFGNSFEKFLSASADGSATKVLLESAKPKSNANPLSLDELSKIRALIGGNQNA